MQPPCKTKGAKASKTKAADSEEDDELLGVTPDGRKQSRVATAAKATKTHKATKAPKATKASKAYDKTDAGLEAEFRRVDADGSGKIGSDEMRGYIVSVVGPFGLDESALTEMMQAADADGDGEIDIDEFKNIMRAGSTDSLLTVLIKRVRRRVAKFLQGVKSFGSEYWANLRANHTIVNAMVPPEEDILGSGLQDEQVIHLFWTAFLLNLALGFLLGDSTTSEVDILQVAYLGLITALMGTAGIFIQKESFSLGNRKARRRTALDALLAKMRHRYRRWKTKLRVETSQRLSKRSSSARASKADRSSARKADQARVRDKRATVVAARLSKSQRDRVLPHATAGRSRVAMSASDHGGRSRVSLSESERESERLSTRASATEVSGTGAAARRMNFWAKQIIGLDVSERFSSRRSRRSSTIEAHRGEPMIAPSSPALSALVTPSPEPPRRAFGMGGHDREGAKGRVSFALTPSATSMPEAESLRSSSPQRVRFTTEGDRPSRPSSAPVRPGPSAPSELAVVSERSDAPKAGESHMASMVQASIARAGNVLRRESDDEDDEVEGATRAYTASMRPPPAPRPSSARPAGPEQPGMPAGGPAVAVPMWGDDQEYDAAPSAGAWTEQSRSVSPVRPGRALSSQPPPLGGRTPSSAMKSGIQERISISGIGGGGSRCGLTSLRQRMGDKAPGAAADWAEVGVAAPGGAPPSPPPSPGGGFKAQSADDAKNKLKAVLSLGRAQAGSLVGGARKAMTAEEVEALRKAEVRERLKQLVPYGRCYRTSRWVTAWVVNVLLYVFLILINFIYAVNFGNVAFEQVMLAWVFSLSTSFLVAEPSQILGSTIIPYLTTSEKAQAWIDYFKEEVLARMGC